MMRIGLIAVMTSLLIAGVCAAPDEDQVHMPIPDYN